MYSPCLALFLILAMQAFTVMVGASPRSSQDTVGLKPHLPALLRFSELLISNSQGTPERDTRSAIPKISAAPYETCKLNARLDPAFRPAIDCVACTALVDGCPSECCVLNATRTQALVCKVGSCCVRASVKMSRLGEPEFGSYSIESYKQTEKVKSQKRGGPGACTKLKKDATCNRCAVAIDESGKEFSCPKGKGVGLPAIDDKDGEPSEKCIDLPGSKKSSQSKCFPANAQVYLEDGTKKAMNQIKIGDSVKVGPGKFSTVFAFTHKDEDLMSEFIRVNTESGESVVASPGHFLYVNNLLAPMSSVRVGDRVTLASGSSSIVSTVSRVLEKGLFNPQTVHGDIVVNGVTTSTYTTAIPPSVAHICLAPLRAMHAWFGWSSSLLQSNISEKSFALMSSLS